MKLCLLDGLRLNEYQKNLLYSNGITVSDNLKECEAVMIRNITKINSKFLDEYPFIKYILRAGVGLDNVDIEECDKRSIKIFNAPGSNAFSVAELFFFHVLNVYRHGCESLKVKDRSRLVGNTLRGKVVGIIGLGHIGKEIAKRLQGWDVKEILYYDVVKYEDFANKYNLSFASLEEIFQRSDIIAICVPLIKSTEKMINQDLLSKSKDVVLVNLSRGKVVDEKAILDALNNRNIKFYCTDVLYDDSHPTSEDKMLLKHPRVFHTPHIGANTNEALENMITQVILSFIEYLNSNS